MADGEVVIDGTADAVIEVKVVGWSQRWMEFGLRSIPSDSRSRHMQRQPNLKVGFRERVRVRSRPPCCAKTWPNGSTS
jgi:predicted NodU family carbamoyl transferase